MLKSMRKSKNRYFYIFVSPGDAPGAITLNVVWMEREFDVRHVYSVTFFTTWRSIPFRLLSRNFKRLCIPSASVSSDLKLYTNPLLLLLWALNLLLMKINQQC